MLIRSAACVVERRRYNSAPGIVLGNDINTADSADAGDIYRSGGVEAGVEKMAETHKRVEQWLATNVTGSQASSHATRHCRLLLAAALFVLGWSSVACLLSNSHIHDVHGFVYKPLQRCQRTTVLNINCEGLRHRCDAGCSVPQTAS